MKIGDKVSVIDDNIEGIITKTEEDIITILCEDGFEMQYTEKELIVMSDIKELNEIVHIPIGEINAKREMKRKISASNKKRKQEPPMEVDLHIHQLVPDCSRLENHEKLTIQLETVKRKVDFAIRKKIQRIVFIHGVGEGVLREELKYLLRRYDNLEFYDADFQKYGVGATEVYIYQNKKA